MTTESNFTGTPESQRALDLIEQRLGHEGPVRDVVIVRSATQTVDSGGIPTAGWRRSAPSWQSSTRAWSGWGRPYYETHAPSQVSADRHSTLIPLSMPGSQVNEAGHEVAPVVALVDRANGQAGFRVLVTGEATLSRGFTKLSESDLQIGEAIGIPIALVILLAVFGTVVAALVPLVLAIFAIFVALALAALIGQISPLSFFVVNMLTFMGLAVGIDYSLFIVSRYREERRHGCEPLEAVTVPGITASRAVLFSGMTVVLALVGMLIVPTKIFVSLAAGAILAVLVAVAAALTVLPAILGLLGDRIESLRVPLFGRLAQADAAPHGGVWGRIVDQVMRRPVIALVSAVTILLVAAIPYFSIHTGSAGLASLPNSTLAKQGFLALDRDFTVGDVTPATIVVDGTTGTPAARRGLPPPPGRTRPRQPLRAASARERTAAPRRDHGAGRRRSELQERPRRGPRPARHLRPDRARRQRVARLRRRGKRPEPRLLRHHGSVPADRVRARARPELHPAHAGVPIGGRAGLEHRDEPALGRGRLRAARAGVAGRPGAGIFGFQQVPTVEAWIPLFLFSVLFGLSMDYHVFLL